VAKKPPVDLTPPVNRSRPLIIKKNGKPRHINFCQQGVIDGKKAKPWKIVIIGITGKRRGKVFRTYKKAKKETKRLAKRYPLQTVTLVSRVQGYGPPRSRITDDDMWAQNRRGYYWCPYCRGFRQFLWDPRWEIEKCPVCRISIRDWHVIYNNPVLNWEKIYG